MEIESKLSYRIILTICFKVESDSFADSTCIYYNAFWQTRARRKLGLTEARPKKESMKENLTPTSPPPAPRKPKPSDLQEVKEGLRDKNLSDVLPKGKATTKDRVNEFVQTNMDKGLALSGQEATVSVQLSLPLFLSFFETDFWMKFLYDDDFHWPSHCHTSLGDLGGYNRIRKKDSKSYFSACFCDCLIVVQPKKEVNKDERHYLLFF